MKLQADPFRPASDLGRIQRAVERAAQADPYVRQADWGNLQQGNLQQMVSTSLAPTTDVEYGATYTLSKPKAAKSYSGSQLMAFAGSGNAPR